jgi:hypothetical protein
MCSCNQYELKNVSDTSHGGIVVEVSKLLCEIGQR